MARETRSPYQSGSMNTSSSNISILAEHTKIWLWYRPCPWTCWTQIFCLFKLLFCQNKIPIASSMNMALGKMTAVSSKGIFIHSGIKSGVEFSERSLRLQGARFVSPYSLAMEATVADECATGRPPSTGRKATWNQSTWGCFCGVRGDPGFVWLI